MYNGGADAEIDTQLFELASEKANEYLRLIPDYTPSQYSAIALFGLLLAKEELQGYKRTAEDQELSDRVNSWIDPRLKFTGECRFSHPPT
jgi:hypothetical protein